MPLDLHFEILKHTGKFAGVTGYYTTEQIFIVLGFLSLLRVKNLEQSQTIPAGELGRCMGIDRISEVKTLRERIAAFCRETDVAGWSRELSREWMECSEDLDGVLYVDGHVRLYYGDRASMPKRFVSRMRLCMSGSTDYRINDRLGEPFFVVNKTLNEGMTKTLINDIISRLNNEVPNQPTDRRNLTER
jgi:hypothetical protein